MDELPIWQSCSQPVNPSHVTINGLAHYCTHNASVNNSIEGHAHTSVLHLDNTHCREHNSTRLLEALHLYVQHCNRILLVQYSILYLFNK